MLWDLFCKVIDNHGDIGVCWRLSRELATRGEQVRLWVDDACALAWMAPQGCAGVQVLPWTPLSPVPEPGDVVVEAFGCELAPAFIEAMVAKTRASGRQPAWINLEYLTAERFAERNHGLPSPAAGLVKYFFYPGFTEKTGGLLRESGLAQRQAAFDRQAWLRQLGIDANGARVVSLFCYEPPALDQLLAQLAAASEPTRLLVTAGRASGAVQAAVADKNRLHPAWNKPELLSISYLPLLAQEDFDHLLWACDLNFVRGEDSVVRALWAGKPFVWHIYPQHDHAHHAKLQAFLDWLQAPASLRNFHAVWNGVTNGPLPLPQWQAWGETAQGSSARLQAQADLATQLLRFASKTR